MIIPVEYRDSSGKIDNKTYSISLLAFAKHMALAGQGYHITPRSILKIAGMFFQYSYYMQAAPFSQNKFSEPPMALSDPTEKGQFSTLVGRAIGDFLSKRIGGALYTVNYEAAMRMQGFKVKGPRPDLISYSTQHMFALEAKGRDSRTEGNMSNHKKQAAAGPLQVHYSVASVAYDLYDDIKCKYWDPVNPDTPYDDVTLRALTRVYYRGFEEFINRRLFNYDNIRVQGESFYKVDLKLPGYGRGGRLDFPFGFFTGFEWLPHYKLYLLLPGNIREMATAGITNQTAPFIYNNDNQGPTRYIDNDRIGLGFE